MRGQGFDVFRLLIAAVVAGAILMVLLGMLQNLTTPTTDPQTAAAQLVKKYSTYGGGPTSTEPIAFKRGMSINGKAIAREAALDPNCIEVDCPQGGDFSKSGDGKTCTYNGSIPKKYRVVVECDEGIGDPSCKGIGCRISIEK